LESAFSSARLLSKIGQQVPVTSTGVLEAWTTLAVKPQLHIGQQIAVRFLELCLLFDQPQLFSSDKAASLRSKLAQVELSEGDRTELRNAAATARARARGRPAFDAALIGKINDTFSLGLSSQ